MTESIEETKDVWQFRAKPGMNTPHWSVAHWHECLEEEAEYYEANESDKYETRRLRVVEEENGA